MPTSNQEEPKFIKVLSSFQKWLARLAGGMFFVVAVTGFNFESDYLKANKVLDQFTLLRMVMLFTATGLTSIVGYDQIPDMIRKAAKLWMALQKAKKELQNEIDKKEE